MTQFIDIHGHCLLEHSVPVLKGEHPDWHHISTPEDMLEFYELHGIERGVIHPLCNAENAFSQSNEEVLEIVRRHPGRFIPFCNVDPRNLLNSAKSRFEDTLRWYRDRGCKGLGELCCNLNFTDGRVQALFKAAEAVGFPVTFHMAPFAENNFGLVDEDGLPGLELSLQRYPKLRFFGHSQAFWAEIAADLGPDSRFGFPSGKIKAEGTVPKLMRKYPNLLGDLSAGSGYNAIARDRAYGAKFLTEFQDRLFFGLDICCPEAERLHPHRLPQLLKDMLATGEITETVFNKVAHDNAIRILGI